MQRRRAFFLLLAFCAGTTGCATSARRSDGTPIFGTNAWSQAPAPPQTALASTNPRPVADAEPTQKPVGLAKYFPGLQRNATEPPKVAARYRPTWFGLRPNKEVVPQTYMTDARAGLNRNGPEPSSLPVALQVPTDRAVTPTNAEAVRPGSTSRPSASETSLSPPPGPDPLASGSGIPDFGGKPSAPGEDEVNPLPPAAEPNSPAAIANRTPELPGGDPLRRPSLDPPDPAVSPASDDKPVQEVAPPAAEPVETSKAVSAPPQPTIQVANPTGGPAPSKTVYASPQSAPPKHSHKVKPTSQVKPSPQSETSQVKKKKCCLLDLIHKICKHGEPAYTPTASPQH